MTLPPDLTVGQLATEHPHALPVLERHRIDYCCGGKRTLAQATARVGISVDQLAHEIEAARPQAADPVDWSQRPVPELIDHIVAAYHEPTYEDLERLGSLARKVCAVHGPTDPGRFGTLLELVEGIEADLVPHMRKEESVLFPWIRRGGGVQAGAAIDVMLTEHDELGHLLRRIRAVTDDYVAPDHACGSWRALWHGLEALERSIHEHVHLENNVLFPRVMA